MIQSMTMKQNQHKPLSLKRKTLINQQSTHTHMAIRYLSEMETIIVEEEKRAEEDMTAKGEKES